MGNITSGAGIDYENQYTISQQKAITYVPLATSILSILGSLAICRIILSDRERKLKKVKQRLILCMSILDVVCSVWFGLWALPVPEGQAGVYGAMGTRRTCSAQGFFIQWQISVPMYNAALSVYYYLVVVRKKKDEEIARRHEPIMHLMCNAYPFVTGIAALFIDGGLYNFDSIGCWIAPYPRGCKHDNDLTCTRGNWAYLFQWLFAGIEEASAAFIIMYCMFFVYREVRTAEITMAQRYSFRRGTISDSKSLAETSRNTLYQALSYVAIVVATRFWSFVVVLIDEFGGSNPFAVVILQQFWFPLQGFWNACVYLQPYYKNVRLDNLDAPWWWCAKEAVLHAPTEEDRGKRRRKSTSATRRNSSELYTERSRRRSSASLGATIGRFQASLRRSLDGSLRQSDVVGDEAEDAKTASRHGDDPASDRISIDGAGPLRSSVTEPSTVVGDDVEDPKTASQQGDDPASNEASMDGAGSSCPTSVRGSKRVYFVGLDESDEEEEKSPNEKRVSFLGDQNDDEESMISSCSSIDSDKAMPDDGADNLPPTEGVVSLSEMSTDVQEDEHRLC